MCGFVSQSRPIQQYYWQCKLFLSLSLSLNFSLFLCMVPKSTTFTTACRKQNNIWSLLVWIGFIEVSKFVRMTDSQSEISLVGLRYSHSVKVNRSIIDKWKESMEWRILKENKIESNLANSLVVSQVILPPEFLLTSTAAERSFIGVSPDVDLQIVRLWKSPLTMRTDALLRWSLAPVWFKQIHITYNQLGPQLKIKVEGSFNYFLGNSIIACTWLNIRYRAF